MSDEDFFALFGEDEAQALRLSSVGIVVTGEGRHRGRNGDDVFPDIPMAELAPKRTLRSSRSTDAKSSVAPVADDVKKKMKRER